MKKKRGGFTLLELVVYLGLFSVLVSVMGRASVQVIARLASLYAETNKVIREALFIDVVRRDLLSASSSVMEWDTKHFVFRKKRLNNLCEPVITDIGFVVTTSCGEKKLLRYEGRYDFARSIWCKKITSVVSDCIDSLSLSCDPAQRRARVSYRLVCNSVQKSFCVRLRNGSA